MFELHLVDKAGNTTQKWALEEGESKKGTYVKLHPVVSKMFPFGDIYFNPQIGKEEKKETKKTSKK